MDRVLFVSLSIVVFCAIAVTCATVAIIGAHIEADREMQDDDGGVDGR